LVRKAYWDEHLSYIIVYKIIAWYTPYQLVYGLHPLMSTEYIVLVVSGNEKDNTLVRILTNKIIELEKLQETKMKKLQEFNSGIEHYGVNKKIQKYSLVLVIMFYDFQRD
jgi:hypothetical protein